ncbi:cell wall-binding repeat-containing protein [Wansuia hejianensis]|uniref:Cell wall-binding repeat-containing protein n=1 Tax=Wansuia hejianensis TaxID=2763667 RepID=A0A926EUR2_9FIRM|nr:cell wall-binding repeat-containing protein [Wansuia hejianensis]MBC8590193.1 cell wall-binding repeat-containing protein [Wansuia hejianensis]
MKKFSKVLSLLLVFAMIVPGIAQAATVDAEEAAVVTRISGGNRYQTAANVSNQKFGKSKTVVLASGENWPDALAGTALAGVEGAPILLTAARRLHPDTKAELISLGAEKVIIVGGETVIPAAVADELKAMGLTVDRKEGLKREDTAVAAAKGMTSKTAIIANGYESFADALSAGAYAGMNGMPILFVRQNSVPAGTLEGLKALGIENVIIAGGTSAVSAKVQSELAAYNPTRIYGEVREETSLAFAEKFENNKEVIIANGYDYADALAGAALGAKIGAPVVLVNTNSMKTVVEGFIKENADKNHTVIGGTSAVSNNVVSDIEEIIAPVESEFKVVSVSAINPTTIKVVFNQEVEELDRADVVVTNVKTSDRQYVKEVKLAEDKKSAEVTFYDALVTKNTYKVVVGEAEKEFDYVVADAAKIEAETTQVVKAGEPTAIEYKVLDANGLDVTNIAKIKFESTLTITDGKVNLAKGTQGFVYVVAVDKDGKEIARSERITVKAEETKAVKLLAYTTDGADFTEKDFEAKHSVRKATGGKLSLYVEDQFEAKSVATGVKFESLNKEVALVDQNNGKITPLKVGTVDVRVIVGDINQIVQVTIEEDAKVASIELDKAEINLSDKLKEGQKVKVTVKDQYGKAVEIQDQAIKAEVKEEAIVTVEGTGKTDDKGVAEFTVKPVEGKEGKAVVEFTHEVTAADGKTSTFKTTLTVNVAKADVVDNYVVEGFEKELDKYVDEDKNTNDMTLRVFGVDANGVKTGEVTENLTIKVLDKDDKEVTGAFENNSNNKIVVTNLTEDETYKVVVKVGTLTVFEDTFTVVDTKPEEAKPVVEQIKSSIKVERDSDLQTALKDAFKVTKNGEGVDISGFTYVSDNTSVIDNDGIKDVGTATLVITKINDSIEVPNLMVNVKVGILTAPEGKTEFTIEEQEIDIKYLASRLMNEAGTAQKVVTLDEVKEFIDSEYGVNFKASNIVLEEGKLSIKGELLSSADWNKVKENGDKTIPYRITVLNTNKTNKLVKIAMYEDGVAIFEEIK